MVLSHRFSFLKHVSSLPCSHKTYKSNREPFKNFIERKIRFIIGFYEEKVIVWSDFLFKTRKEWNGLKNVFPVEFPLKKKSRQIGWSSIVCQGWIVRKVLNLVRNIWGRIFEVDLLRNLWQPRQHSISSKHSMRSYSAWNLFWKKLKLKVYCGLNSQLVL